MAEAVQLDLTPGDLGKKGCCDCLPCCCEWIPPFADVVSVFGALVDVQEEADKDIAVRALDDVCLEDDEWLVWAQGEAVVGSSILSGPRSDLAMCQNKQVNAVWHVAVASIGGSGHELGDFKAVERLRATILENTKIKKEKEYPSVPFVYISVLKKVATMRSVIEPLHPLFRDGAYEKLLPSTAFGNLYVKIGRSGGVLNGLRAGKLGGRVYLCLEV